MGVFQTMPISFGHFPLEITPTFPAQEPEKIPQFRRYFMKTGLNKRQKTTSIYFDEYIKVWFSSACTNMSQQTNTTR